MSEILKLTVFFSLMTNENWIQACIATFLISALPAILLIFVPLTILKSKFYGIKFLNVLLSFAAGGLLGDVFIHAIPHLLMNSSSDVSHSHDESAEPHGHDHHEGHDHDHGAGHDHGHMTFIGISILVGFFIFFIADRIAEYHMLQKTIRRVKKQDYNGVNSDNDVGNDVDSNPGSKMVTRSAKKSKKLDSGSNVNNSSSSGIKESDSDSTVGSFGRMAATGWLNMMADTMHNFTDGIAIGVAYNSNNPSLAFATTLSVMVHEIPHVGI